MKLICTMFAAVFFMSTAIAQNVGIGTTTPVNKLSVNGKMDVTDSIGIGTTTPASLLHLQSTNISDTSRGDIILSRYWNNNSDTRASSIFHYHYSTTTPNSDNLAFGVSGDRGSFLRPNAVSQIKMLIQANGDVGIGTIRPKARLDVAGNVKINDGTQGEGKVFKSNNDGLGSWSKLKATDILTTPPMYNLSCPVVTGMAQSLPPSSIAVSGNYAYVLGFQTNYMQIFNISNPTLPTLAATVQTGVDPNAVAVSGNYAYIVNKGNGYQGTLKIINISNPEAPFEEGMLTLPGPFSIAISNNYAYVGNMDNTMSVINISNPSSPLIIGSVTTGNIPRSIAIAGNYAYVLYYVFNTSINTMQAINIADPASPTLSGSVSTKTGPSAVAAIGNYAYVIHSHSDTLQIFNISNPTAPTAVGSVKMNNNTSFNSINLAGNYAVTAGSGSIFIINISNPVLPTVASSLALPTSHSSYVAVSNNYAYVTSTPGKLFTINMACSTDYAITVNPVTGQTVALPLQWNTTNDNISNTNAGNVGIGTNTPTQKLEVSGTTKTTNLQITSGANNGFILKSDASGNASWVNTNTIETDPKIGTLTGNKIPKWNGTTLADGLVFDNGTNVGIGTVTPAQKLDVNGTTKTTNLQITSGATNGFILKSDASGNASWVNANTIETDPKVGTLTSNKIPKWNGITLADGLVFDNGINVGIGTTAPAAKLHVASSSTGLRIDVPATQTAFSIGGAGSIKVDAIGVEGGRLLINDNGNMGIGTPTPTTTLDVNGGIRTKYSGTVVFDVVGGLVTTLNITIPAVPADWNVGNTIVIVTNADGVDGVVRQAKLTSTTNIAVKYIQDSNGLARLNWVIFRM